MANLLLFVGDLHLGRRPLRVPEGLDPTRLGPEEAWRRTVAFALSKSVAAVLLAGDVVESLEDRFEAERQLRPGIEALSAAGIPVLAVAGNHDVNALPRLATLLPSFELIGRGGWDHRDLSGDAGPFCRIHGWSFEQPLVRENPLRLLDAGQLAPHLANIGLLHCDRDAATSRHAPVTTADFEQGAAARMDAFFLGHIHKPDHETLTASRPLGYLGSLVGLDPGEPGCHGPWLVAVEGPGRMTARQIPLGPLRWERRDLALDIDLEGEGARDRADIADLEDRLAREIRGAMIALHEELGAEADQLDALGLRLRLIGRQARPQALARAAARFSAEDQALEVVLGSCRYFCEKVESAVLPTIDLDELARGPGALASVASFIIALERGENVDLLGLEEELELLLGRRSWADLQRREAGEIATSERLVGAARALLGTMLERREIEA